MSRHVLAARSGVVSSSTRPARRLWSSLSRTFDALISRTALAAGFWTSRPSRSRPRWSKTGYLRLCFEPLESRAMLSINVSAPSQVVEGDTFPVSFDSGNLPGAVIGYVAAFSDGTNVSLGPDATSVDHYFSQGPSDESVAITAFDDLGNSDSGSASIHVNNIPPQLAISGDSAVGAGVFYALNLSATEAGPHYIQFWSINWGAGSSETIWGNPSGVSHQYMTPGEYTIAVTAGDDTGVYSAGSQTVTVSATPPTLGISGPSWVNEGDVYTLGMSGTNGSGTISSWDLIWGDGSSPVNLPGNPSSAAHTYMVGPNHSHSAPLWRGLVVTR